MGRRLHKGRPSRRLWHGMLWRIEHPASAARTYRRAQSPGARHGPPGRSEQPVDVHGTLQTHPAGMVRSPLGYRRHPTSAAVPTLSLAASPCTTRGSISCAPCTRRPSTPSHCPWQAPAGVEIARLRPRDARRGANLPRSPFRTKSAPTRGASFLRRLQVPI
jgi:hypothetical protein